MSMKPSLAEMASQQKFFAVQNLCRRCAPEYVKKVAEEFNGKTVFQWAAHYGETDLLAELNFFFQVRCQTIK